jgi:hypothetical protein
MRIAISLFVVYSLAVALAYVGTPEDPYSFVLAQFALSAFGIVAFALGWRARRTTFQ